MFSKRLVLLRKSKKLSQYQLADKLALSRGQIANYEQGTREPDYETLQLIADFFDVSVDYLLGREAKEAPTGDASLEEKMKFFEEIESEIGIDLSDPKMQEMLKRAAKIMFIDKE